MDVREGLNAVSDVIVNRPTPIRGFDQIYMKAADMLIQAEHVLKWVGGKEVVFIGDGDAIAPLLIHIHSESVGIGTESPKRVHVMDFDERVVNGIARLAARYGYTDRLSAELYNVVDPLPPTCRGQFDAFYTNPPYGSNNGGKSVKAFFCRGMEAIKNGGLGCGVIADYPSISWCDEVLHTAQMELLSHGFVVAEMIPQFHRYHLDDVPELTSCSLIARHVESRGSLPRQHQPMPDDVRLNFYGKQAPLKVHYVRDHREGLKLPSKDYSLELLSDDNDDPSS